VQEALDTQKSYRQFQYAYGIDDGVNPVQETSGATVLANMLTGLGVDEFFTRTEVALGTTSHLLRAALSSTIAVADNSGVVQTEHTYEPFGGTITTGTSNMNPFQYTGRENDTTGLYYYRARYYQPMLKRFIAEDPLFSERTRGNNLYAYVDNNPITFLDPRGLSKTSCPKKDCLKECLEALADQVANDLRNCLAKAGVSSRSKRRSRRCYNLWYNCWS
jgi:RHS repeat-associated protein